MRAGERSARVEFEAGTTRFEIVDFVQSTRCRYMEALPPRGHARVAPTVGVGEPSINFELRDAQDRAWHRSRNALIYERVEARSVAHDGSARNCARSVACDQEDVL